MSAIIAVVGEMDGTRSAGDIELHAAGSARRGGSFAATAAARQLPGEFAQGVKLVAVRRAGSGGYEKAKNGPPAKQVN